MEIQQCAGPVTILAERMSVFAARLRAGLESIPDCVVPAATRPDDTSVQTSVQTAETLSAATQEDVRRLLRAGSWIAEWDTVGGISWLAARIPYDSREWTDADEAVLAAIAQVASPGGVLTRHVSDDAYDGVEGMEGMEELTCTYWFTGAGGVQSYPRRRLYGDWPEVTRTLVRALTQPTSPAEVERVCAQAMVLLAANDESLW